MAMTVDHRATGDGDTAIRAPARAPGELGAVLRVVY